MKDRTKGQKAALGFGIFFLILSGLSLFSDVLPIVGFFFFLSLPFLIYGSKRKAKESIMPQLVPGEQVLWERDLTKGAFRKEIIEIRLITNLAVRINQQSLDLSLVDAIEVTDRHSKSEGSYTSYGKYGIRMGYGKSRSRQYGNILFFSGGRMVVTMYDVEDPHSVVRKIKAARKSMGYKL